MRAPGACGNCRGRQGMDLDSIGDDGLRNRCGDVALQQTIEVAAIENERVRVFYSLNRGSVVLIGDQNVTGAGRAANAGSRLTT
ncbi:hypothetical protein BH10PLA2_BH10PLA2_38060 [soil metagenome]